jgi:spermidine/putrescine transport system substrate-binding protein
MPDRPISAAMSRRRFLGHAGRLAGGLALAPAALAACGGGTRAGDQTTATVAPGANGSLVIENWPVSIDTDDTGDPAGGATIRGFRDATGIAVDYRTTITDDAAWLAAHERELASGAGIGTDIAVLTGWMVERLVSLGYVQELDRRAIPNAANLVDTLAHPDYDPNRKFSLPWTSGMTGIAYDPVKTDREVTSVRDLFDPAFAGHVSLLPEMRDTLGLVMLGQGRDPATCTLADAQAAVDELLAATAQGQFVTAGSGAGRDSGSSGSGPGSGSGAPRSGPAGADRTEGLVRGTTWIGIAWSGDITALRARNPNLRFVVPAEGSMLFTDNMVLPLGAADVANAHAWMDYVYQPTVSAEIHAATHRIPPVAGTAEPMQALDPGLTVNPLIFPTVDVQQRLHVFRSLSLEDERSFAGLFGQLQLP